MTRPWQIWLVFGLALTVAVSAMALLTWRALELDRDEAQARSDAALENKIGSALWRMDTQLSSILAPEIGRPYYVYAPAYQPDASEQRLPSPLLAKSSPFISLHFQVDAANQWTSPQCPTSDAREIALREGICTLPTLACNGTLLTELSRDVSPGDLRLRIPGPKAVLYGESTDQDAARSPTTGIRFAQSNYNSVDWVLDAVPGGRNDATAQPVPDSNPSNVEQARQSVNINARDLHNRGQMLQAGAAQQRLDQSSLWSNGLSSQAREGISQPVWIGGKLLIARLVWIGDAELIQGCWLNWDEISAELRRLVVDILPNCQLEPATQLADYVMNRMLASLPAKIVTAPAPTASQLWSPIRVALAFAWSMLALAVGAVAVVLQGVVRLSERRAAFVSAVTHELRTPLTTFRMYSEMLSSGMVADPQRRQEYLSTLQVESRRLSHLVDNVLQYARLERTSLPRRRVALSLDELLARTAPRLAERALAAQFELHQAAPGPTAAAARVLTDPVAVEQILFNLVDNACKYAQPASSRRLDLQIEVRARYVAISVIDHGPGMPTQVAKTMFQPFSKTVERAAETAPGVGLGLALSQRLARQLGGRLHHQSTLPPPGATFELQLPLV